MIELFIFGKHHENWIGKKGRGAECTDHNTRTAGEALFLIDLPSPFRSLRLESRNLETLDVDLATVIDCETYTTWAEILCICRRKDFLPINEKGKGGIFEIETIRMPGCIYLVFVGPCQRLS